MAKDYPKGSISDTAQKRKDKLTGKSADAKAIETRVNYEATEEGFTRGGAKPKSKK